MTDETVEFVVLIRLRRVEYAMTLVPVVGLGSGVTAAARACLIALKKLRVEDLPEIASIRVVNVAEMPEVDRSTMVPEPLA